MTKTLVCEICRESIALFDEQLLTDPIDLSIFKSIMPERDVPDPFPPSLKMWDRAICPICRRRPFFNHMDKGDGTYIVSTGDTVPADDRWFVLVKKTDGEGYEKLLLSKGMNLQDDAALSPREPEVDQEQDSFVEEDEPTAVGTYKSPPVACPKCGKQFRSQGRLEKYHKDCPGNSPPPREGNRI